MKTEIVEYKGRKITVKSFRELTDEEFESASIERFDLDSGFPGYAGEYYMLHDDLKSDNGMMIVFILPFYIVDSIREYELVDFKRSIITALDEI
ncbi:unnamed protein product [marine sediment metagenome]|uniref:Uncharacterized protein n=1 Tax=marine sediment metagenome TaxID=412755 RepID=X0WJ08_9ZZZZ